MAIVGEAFVLIRPDTTPFMPELEAKMAAAQAVAPVGSAAATGVPAEAAATAAAVEGEAARVTKAVESVAPAAEETATRGGKAFSSLANLFSIQSKSMTGSSNLIADSLGKVDKAGFDATASIEGAGSGMAAALAVVVAAAAAVGGSAIEFEHWGEAVFRVSELTGAGAAQASRLVYAFDLAGVSTDKVAVALGRLSRNVQGGNLDLERYGLEVAKNANGSIDLEGTLLNLSDAMQRLGPGAESTSLAIATLGRGGAALVPILVQGRQALQDLMAQTPGSLVLSDEDAKRAHEFGIELRQLKIDAQAVFVSMGKDLIPTLLVLAGTLDFVARHGEGVVKFLFKLIDPLSIVTGHLTGSSSGLNAEIQKTIKALTDQADAADASAEAEQRAQTATKELTDKMNALGQAAASVINDERAVEQSHRTRADAELSLQKAIDDLNKIQKAGGVDTDKYTAATDRARSAIEALTRAQHEASDAAEDIHTKTLALAEATDLYGQGSEEARKARKDLDDAHFRSDQAAQAGTDAQRDLTRAQDDQAKAAAGGADALQKLRDAQQRVTDARAGVEDAIYGEATAAAQLKEDMDAAGGKTDTAVDKTQNLIDALGVAAGTLAVDSPIRKNLEGYIDSLKRALAAETDLAEQANGFAQQQANKYANFATGEANPVPNTAAPGAPITQPAHPGERSAITINVYGVNDPAQTAATVDSFLSGDWLPAPVP